MDYICERPPEADPPPPLLPRNGVSAFRIHHAQPATLQRFTSHRNELVNIMGIVRREYASRCNVVSCESRVGAARRRRGENCGGKMT